MAATGERLNELEKSNNALEETIKKDEQAMAKAKAEEKAAQNGIAIPSGAEGQNGSGGGAVTPGEHNAKSDDNKVAAAAGKGTPAATQKVGKGGVEGGEMPASQQKAGGNSTGGSDRWCRKFRWDRVNLNGV